MLSTDVRFEGWTTESWQRFLSLWRPRAEPTRAAAVLLVIHDGEQVLKLVHSERGRLPRPRVWPQPLELLAAEHRAGLVIAARHDALDQIAEDFSARLAREDDLLSQFLKLLASCREALQTSALQIWPWRLAGVPAPTERMVVRALDSICADAHTMLLALFQDDKLWTALCVRRRGAELDLIAGPEDLAHSVGLLSGDFRRDYVHIARACTELYGPLSFGCFAEVDTFRALQIDAEPGAWSRAALVRDIILSPLPGAVGLALGFDGARMAFENLRVVTERVDRFGVLEGVLRSARKQVGKALSDRDVTEALGFDPLAVLRTLLRR